MTTVSMRVSCRSLKAAQTLFFDIPDEGHYDLRAAWSRFCGLEAFNDVVRGFKHTTKFGIFESYHCGKWIGTVTIRRLQIYDTRVSPSYRVWFHLESGLQWTETFECEISDLIKQVHERLDGSPSLGYINRGRELQQAAQVFDPELCFPKDETLESLSTSLQYAGVTIGTVTIKRSLNV